MNNSYLHKNTLKCSDFLLLALLLHISACNSPLENNNYLFNSIDNKVSGLDFTNNVIENEDFNILEYLYFTTEAELPSVISTTMGWMIFF